MRIHPKAKAKGARKRFARHANNKQNGLGKYQQTGLLVSFCLTSHKQVLDRAQPPTLQQGGSPMLIVFEGWTLAAMVYSSLVLRLGLVEHSRGELCLEAAVRRSDSDGCPWGAGICRQRALAARTCV